MTARANRVLLALGSNLGDRVGILQRAVGALGEIAGVLEQIADRVPAHR